MRRRSFLSALAALAGGLFARPKTEAPPGVTQDEFARAFDAAFDDVLAGGPLRLPDRAEMERLTGLAVGTIIEWPDDKPVPPGWARIA